MGWLVFSLFYTIIFLGMRTKLHKSKDGGKHQNPFVSTRNSSNIFGVQAKLQVGQPNDKYENEADKVASQVVNNVSSNSRPFFAPAGSLPVQKKMNGLLQEKPLAETITPFGRQPEEEEMAQGQPVEEDEEMVQGQPIEEEEEKIQGQSSPEEEEEPVQTKLAADQIQKAGEEKETKPTGQSGVAPAIESQLKNSAGGGRRMDSSTRTKMESGFGADFGDVNIHTDARAVQMNKELGAQAFTHGKDIYFNQGKYNPESNDGKHLLAHELTHTIQQTGMIPANLQMTIGDNRDLTAARFSGNLVLEACLDNEQTLQVGSSGAAVSLIQQALVDAGFPLPRFGVDGIFGSETRGALQDFQRASGLDADGILGQHTMSALDGLFTGGAPALPPAVPVVPAPVTPPGVTSQTVRSAPDGTPDTRTTVGVGERVRFTADTAGTWSVSHGRIIGLNTGSNMVWEAPPTATAPTITITTPGGTRVIPFTVIAPNNLSMVVATRDAIPAGTAGACMITNVTVNPLSVNFGRTQWLEVPGPATNVSGYFNQFAAATIFHNPNPNYLPFNDNNTGLRDHASWHAVPAPFSFGTFEWVIPNRYKIDGESDAQGRLFTNTVQAFFMFPGGTMMITKAGASVIRFINNTVI
jgi:peptidoglycan hydrolase-like protein with peptidoglycan-binding domain